MIKHREQVYLLVGEDFSLNSLFKLKAAMVNEECINLVVNERTVFLSCPNHQWCAETPDQSHDKDLYVVVNQLWFNRILVKLLVFFLFRLFLVFLFI